MLETHTQTLSWTTSGLTSTAVSLSQSLTGAMLIPADMTCVTTNFLACDTLAGTYNNVRNATATEAVAVVAGSWSPLTASVMAHGFLKLKTPRAEAAGRTVTIITKTGG